MRWLTLALLLLVIPAGAGRAAAAAPAVASAVSIDVGGGPVANWRADPGPSSGAPTVTSATAAPIDVSGVAYPAPAAVYASNRSGSAFTYTLAGLVAGARYSVRLHFAETTFTQAGQRLFDVAINGVSAATNVDIVALAGAPNRAAALVAPATASSSGRISIAFAGLHGSSALVSAIELQPSVHIRAAGGRVSIWSALPTPSSGRTTTAISTDPIDLSGVVGPAPQAVYQASRSGSAFAYTVGGLAPGAASIVRLHFAEVRAVTAVGQRLMNVTVNGAPALWNFDVFAAAGAADRAVTRSFGTTASAAGTIAIGLSGVNGANAIISGIEIGAAGLVAPSAADSLTDHSDVYRTGWNPQEQILTNANVSTATFGLLGQLPVDGSVDAQPLVATGVAIPPLGARHDLLLVATEKDSVYAFDAQTGAIVWQRSLVGAGERSLTTSDVDNCTDTMPDIGILGTPVIDRASNTLYVDAATYVNATSSYHHRLHALSLSSGVDAITPVDVTGAIAGTGQVFDPQWQRQRAGLTLAHGTVYVAFGSYCDIAFSSVHAPVVGWLFGFSAATLTPISGGDAFSNQHLDSVWQGGIGPAADASGDLYFSTGNGTFDDGANLSNSIIKTAPSLARLDSFTARNVVAESAADIDMASGGVTLVPDQPGPYPHLALHEGKVPAVRVLDRDDLGGYSGGVQAPENILAYAYSTPCDPTISIACADAGSVVGNGYGIWGGIAYYVGPNAQQYVVVGDSAANAHAYALRSGKAVTLTPAARSSTALPLTGATPVVSSDGTLPGSALVWLINRSDPTFTLDVYDASSMRRIRVLNSAPGQNPATSPMVGPTVVNGRVYVGTQVLATGTGLVSVYGLLGPSTPFAPAVHGAAPPAAAPIRLAGPVVYGPGSRVVARPLSVARFVAPTHRDAQVYFGTLRAGEPRALTFAIRTGRALTVDARAAFAAGHVSTDLRIGNACAVTVAPPNRAGRREAVSVVRIRRPLAMMPPDGQGVRAR